MFILYFMIQYLGQPNGQQQIQQIPYVEAKKKYKNSIADKNGNAFWVAWAHLLLRHLYLSLSSL